MLFFIHILQKQSIIHNRNYVLDSYFNIKLLPWSLNNVPYNCNARFTPHIDNMSHISRYQQKQVLESIYLPPKTNENIFSREL